MIDAIGDFGHLSDPRVGRRSALNRLVGDLAGPLGLLSDFGNGRSELIGCHSDRPDVLRRFGRNDRYRIGELISAIGRLGQRFCRALQFFGGTGHC